MNTTRRRAARNAGRTIHPFASVHPAPYSYPQPLTAADVMRLRRNFHEDVKRCVQANPRLYWSDNTRIVMNMHPIYEMFGKKAVYEAVTPRDMVLLRSSRSDATSATIRRRRIQCFVPTVSMVSAPVRRYSMVNGVMLIGSSIGVMDLAQMTDHDSGAYLKDLASLLSSASPKCAFAIQSVLHAGHHHAEAVWLQRWAMPISTQATVNQALLNARLF